MGMISRLIRRTHMYFALFLVPWMLMYAVSTMTMNHRSEGAAARWEKEREETYTGTFPSGATPRVMARQILISLGMDGAHAARGPSPDGKITIFRNEPIAQRRLTFSPADGKLLVEREVFRASAFLERFHRRRGFEHPYALADAWAFSVDLAIFAMVFWVASGLWMWWEMRPTRGWGALTLALGLGLFTLFLVTI